MRTLSFLIIAACASPHVAPIAASDRIAIAISERGASGARLVAVDEHGNRQLEIVRASETLARDTNPAISPNGAWIVFASSRGRSLEQTSLWIAPLVPDAVPVQLTTGTAIDSHPVWRRDGNAIIFASTRSTTGTDDTGTFALYEPAIDARGHPAGELRALTAGGTTGHQITPTVAADGTVIYAAITPLPGGEVESHLEERAPDGTISKVTAGPADTSPALSPDGRWIVFARPKEHKGVPDGELWLLPRGGDSATQLIDLPVSDESGPVWSPDGRFVFATSVLRGAAGNVLFSSVIVVDTRALRPVARILEDHVGAIVRLTPAIAPTRLDAAALDADPEYGPELVRITAAAIAAAKGR